MKKKNCKVLHLDYKPELKETQKKYDYRIDTELSSLVMKPKGNKYIKRI